MIIWIASYPRSGNTLVRTILKQVFNINSYDNELKVNDQNWKEQYEPLFHNYGHIEYEGKWNEFYYKLKNSKDIFFVKTHLPPEDDSPAIYIVRDGRKAIVSYFHFMKQFFPETERSILDLILGNDYYGDWTSHYNSWMPKNRKNTLLIKYEKIINEPNIVISEIENFINIKRIKPWVNPFYDLKEKGNSFFREGTSEWTGAKEWSEFYDRLFIKKHYNLMSQLKYDIEHVQNNKVEISDNELEEIKLLFEKKKIECNMYREAAKERLELINRLHGIKNEKI